MKKTIIAILLVLVVLLLGLLLVLRMHAAPKKTPVETTSAPMATAPPAPTEAPPEPTETPYEEPVPNGEENPDELDGPIAPGSYFADVTENEGENDGPLIIEDNYVVILDDNEANGGD